MSAYAGGVKGRTHACAKNKRVDGYLFYGMDGNTRWRDTFAVVGLWGHLDLLIGDFVLPCVCAWGLTSLAVSGIQAAFVAPDVFSG